MTITWPGTSYVRLYSSITINVLPCPIQAVHRNVYRWWSSCLLWLQNTNTVTDIKSSKRERRQKWSQYTTALQYYNIVSEFFTFLFLIQKEWNWLFNVNDAFSIFVKTWIEFFFLDHAGMYMHVNDEIGVIVCN
jgi:K+-transporting ATPase A subunit